MINDHYHNTDVDDDDDDDDDDRKVIPLKFYSHYCHEWEKYKEFVNTMFSNHRSPRPLVTCNYCQNDIKTFNDRKKDAHLVVD